MREKFAETFYHSWQWERCRKAYAKSKNGLCERCLAKGIYKPGTQVHHKVHLTPENLTDTRITLNWSNLELLCNDCHHEEHRAERRWRADPDGTVRL